MSSPEKPDEIYVDELKDLRCGNDPIPQVVKKLTTKASDASLEKMWQTPGQDQASHRRAESSHRWPG